MRLTTLPLAVVVLAIVSPGRADGPTRIAGLVEQLGDDKFVQRELASKSLEAIGEPALHALVEAAATTKDSEVRRRARRLIAAVMSRKFESKTTGMAMVGILASDYQMGSPRNERNRRIDEPLHRVRFARPFYMGTYEVTQDEYFRVMKKSPSWFSPTGSGKDKVDGVAIGRFPVENVTWFDAVEFCNRLGRLDGFRAYYKMDDVDRSEGGSITSATITVLGGNGYRLPTEAEWEYACRAGTTAAYHFGPVPRQGDANMRSILVSGGYGSSPKWPDPTRTQRVGTSRANAWGFYDMHGNVAEWCFDWYDKEYYDNSPPADPRGPLKGKHRVLRGGSWLVNEANCRSASRFWQTPDEKKYHTGFRVVRNP